MLYADYNSTSPVLPEVLEAMLPYLTEEFGNPASDRTLLGKTAKEAVENARIQVASLVNASPEEVVFVSGGTESCFDAILGSFSSRHERKEFICSAVEHSAVLETFSFLKSLNSKTEIIKIPVSSNSELDFEKLKSSVSKNTNLVSVMIANNETGALFDVKKIAELVHEQGTLIHTDAVQAVGKIEIDFKNLDADLLSLSGHKFGAPKGIGALIVKKGLIENGLWKPPIVGGGQERGLRGGTSAVHQIVALGCAAEIRTRELEYGLTEKLRKLRDEFEKLLLEKVTGVTINCADNERLPNTSSFLVNDVVGLELMDELALQNIFVSTGSACSTGKLEPSHVLTALNLDTVSNLSSVRVSFGAKSTVDDVRKLVFCISETASRLREKSAVEFEKLFIASAQ
jgi:cysteine desulfurase